MFEIIRYLARFIIEAYDLILLVYCVSSWIIRDPFNKFMRVLSTLVDPVLDPINNVLNRIPFFRGFPISFAPLIAFALLRLILYFI